MRTKNSKIDDKNEFKGIEEIVENYATHLNNTSILDELLHEVALAADQLESRIEDHVVNNPANSGQIEAVMHLRENEEESDSDDYELDSGDILVDSQNNKERDTFLCELFENVKLELKSAKKINV